LPTKKTRQQSRKTSLIEPKQEVQMKRRIPLQPRLLMLNLLQHQLLRPLQKYKKVKKIWKERISASLKNSNHNRQRKHILTRNLSPKKKRNLKKRRKCSKNKEKRDKRKIKSN